MDVDFVFHGLLATGIVIILGLVGGKLATRVRIPKITGYLLMGVLIGPSGLALVSSELAQDISIVKDIALGMLLFAIGGVFEFHRFKKVGVSALQLTLLVAAACFTVVTAGLYLITGDVLFSATMGAISITTSPGAALLVTREYNSSGPLTETLLLMVGISNVLSIMTFELIQMLGSYGTQESSLFHLLTGLLSEIVAAVIIGSLVGALLSWWESRVEDQAELILAFVAGILVVTGLAKSVHVNPLLPALVTGVVTTNMSMMHRLIYVEMRQTEQPLYIAFFVLSGVLVDLRLLWTLGMAGLGYTLFRAVCKVGGAMFFAKRMKLQNVIWKYMGPALVAQGGVAIGLAMTLSETNTELEQMVSPVVLGSVIIFEIFGPPAIRWSLLKAGETRE